MRYNRIFIVRKFPPQHHYFFDAVQRAAPIEAVVTATAPACVAVAERIAHAFGLHGGQVTQTPKLGSHPRKQAEAMEYENNGMQTAVDVNAAVDTFGEPLRRLFVSELRESLSVIRSVARKLHAGKSAILVPSRHIFLALPYAPCAQWPRVQEIDINTVIEYPALFASSEELPAPRLVHAVARASAAA